MVKTASFKRLILRAVLRQVSPMVIRLVSVADQMPLHEFHDVFRTILGWNGDLGYIVRVHGQEINSFRRKTRSKALHEFKLHRQEKFLYVCDTLHMWEWDVRVLDIQEGVEGDHAPVCVGGRGAAPPEFCGGPTGYRLMLKRQREGAAMSDPVRLEAGVQMLAEGLLGSIGTNLGPAPHRVGRGLSEHRSKTARTRPSATRSVQPKGGQRAFE
jgi:Plasmid pRiA4b ORF-3-like protein